MNNIFLSGYVSYKEQIKEINKTSHKLVFKIGVNTGQKVFDQNTQTEKNKYEYYRVEIWNQAALFADANIKDGDYVFVTGSLRTSKFISSQTNLEVTIIYIAAHRVEIAPMLQPAIQPSQPIEQPATQPGQYIPQPGQHTQNIPQPGQPVTQNKQQPGQPSGFNGLDNNSF